MTSLRKQQQWFSKTGSSTPFSVCDRVIIHDTYMKYLAATLLFIGACAFPPSAHAVLVGTLDSENMNNLLTEKDASVSLLQANPSELVDLGVRITTDGNDVLKKKDTYYFTSSAGFQSFIKGDIQTATLKRGTLRAVTHDGTTIVISKKKTKTQKAGSFLFDAATETYRTFSPTIGEIIDASMIKGGKGIAMIAKNGEGKQKLFVATSNVAKPKEYPLPQYATSCTTVSFSPDAKYLHVGCTFNIPKQPKGQKGSVLVTIGKGAMKPQRRTVENVTLVQTRWLSATKLVTLEQATTNTHMYANTVSGGRVTSKQSFGSMTLTTFNGAAAYRIPAVLARHSDTAVFTNFFFATVNEAGAVSFVGSAIGYYNIVTSAETSFDDSTDMKILWTR
jgi:hypothetical protein